MASGTRRYGRVLKDEGTSSSRSENAVGKAKDIQGASTSCSPAISVKSRVETSSSKDAKIVCGSGSAATDLSTLRKSIRETPSKKKKKTCPGLQKSEILENESLSSPYGSAATDSSSLRKSTREKPSKKMREASPSPHNPVRLENEALSTPSASAATDSSCLRRSIRETTSNKMSEQSPSSRKPDNEVLSTPSDKKKSENEDKKHFESPVRRSERIEKHGTPGSSYSKKSKKISSLSGKEKGKDEAAGKSKVSGTGEQSNNKIRAVKSAGPSTKKKRLNARCYRALLLPPEKKTEISDVDCKKLNDDSASKGNNCDSGLMKCDDSKKVQKDGDECTGRRMKLGNKHSDEYSKETVEIPSSGSRELAELILQNSEERKSIHLVGKRKRKFEDRSPASNCIGSSSQSSGAEKEINGEDDRLCMHSLDKEKLESPELIPTDEGKAVAPSFGDDFGGCKSEKLVNLDSDVAATPVNEEFVDADPSIVDSFSSPIGVDNEIMKQCPDCCKLQRIGSISQAQELCSCNLQRKNDVPNLSLEQDCDMVSTSRNPCDDETVATSSLENSTKWGQQTEARDSLAVSEKQNCIVTYVNPNNVSVPVIEDRRRPGVDDGVGITEEHLSSNLKETSLAIQTVSGVNACVFCKLPGLLLFCYGKACKMGYHLSCLNPPLQEIPPGVWLCHCCVKKKLESGVHSVSEGIEAIWDVKEGTQNGRQYFVKYKDLAHVHNLWIPERQLLLEDPVLVAQFNKKNQKETVTRWKQEWAKPHRLLHKRLIMPKNLSDEYISLCGDKISYCYHEWLVKWKDLGYEFATWELENSPFLCAAKGAMLIKDYERRRMEAKQSSDPTRAEKALQVKKDPFRKLTRLPDEWPAGLDNDHIISVNRLREFWHKSQNAIFIDDQERIIKSILFIGALLSHTTRPFLVISTIASLSLWESEFIRLAPSINVVVYNGNKDTRKMIRTLEFYEEGGCIMFEVLLSHPEAINEDFEAVGCISWEAVLIDECQSSKVSEYLERLKCLSTDFRLLLCAQLKDTVAEYINLLLFLESGGKENGTTRLNIGSDDPTGSLSILKDRLGRYLAYECKPDSGKFVEYWVPVRLSNVQLEQYCATLVSNSITLRASSKTNNVGALQDILISTRKCCDHPYLVDEELQRSLTKGLPADRYLDIGVKASGKLLLLDKLLQEIKKQGLRVLILFQSIGGAGRNPIGDILDDFIRQRFGADSYERIDRGLVMSKKLAALSMFNDKTKGRFVFLIENRACLPSVKLSSVDAVIIYDSDWNPSNDLRALQRITIESDFEHVKVFRLFSSCTVEEKVLIFAKQDMILESNIQNVSHSHSHLLLSWGAIYLFSELDLFHQNDNMSNHSEASREMLILNDDIMKFSTDVTLEIMAQLSGKDKSCNASSSFLVKAMHSGASYSRNMKLAGEKDGISSLDTDSTRFWSVLLENRNSKWRFVLDQSPRTRKRARHFGESIKLPEVESDEVRRKHRKLACNMFDPISLQTWLQDRTKGTSTGKDSCINDNTTHRSLSISPQKTLCSPDNMLKEPELDLDRVNAATNDVSLNLHTSWKSDDSAELNNSPTVDLERREKLRDAQRSLHLLLKPELEKLCDVLKLPEDVKGLAQRCLEYIMNNLHVSRESETILQALKLSVCWRAASFLKHKVHYTECLALAKKYLNYACDQEQALSVYSKLRLLKKTFSRASSLQNENEPNSSQNQLSASRHANADQQLNGVESNLGPLTLPESGETRAIPDGPRLSENAVMEQEQAPVLESPSKIQENLGSLKDALLKKRVDLIEKICSKRAEDLLLKQHVELSDFNVDREETKMRLKSVHDSDLVAIRDIHIDYTSRSNKIKLLNEKFSKEMTEYDQHMRSQRSKLAVMQEDARIKEEEIRHRWLEEAKEGILAESFDNFPLTESGFKLEEFKVVTRVADVCNGSGEFVFVSRPASDQACSDMITLCPEEGSVLPNRRVESAAVETEVPACHSDNMVLVGFAKADGALVLRSASDESCNDMIVAGPGGPTGSSTNVLEIPSNTPNESFKDLPINRSDKRGEVESIKPSGTSAVIPSSFPLREGVMSMEIETLPSQSCTMNAEGSGVGAVLTESALGTVVDRGLQQVEDNSDNTCLISYPRQIQTELQSDIVDAVNIGPDLMLIDSTIATTTSTTVLAPTSVDRDPHECENSRDGTCLLSPLEQNHAEPVPSFSTFPSSVCEVSVILNPISSLDEHERPAASVSTVPGQEGTSQQIAVPALEPVNVVPSQDDQGSQHRSFLNSRPFGLPAPVDISTENSPENPPLVFESECDPQVPVSSALQNEVSMQQLITDTTVQTDPTNQLVSHSAVPPLPSFSSNIRPERIPSEHLVSSGAQSYTSLASPWIAPQVLGSDPLQNELARILKQDEFCTEMHEQKKQQLELERDQEIEREIERIRKKYEVLIQDAEIGFLRDKKILERVHNNVLLNRVLAEEFRAKFIENKGGTSSFSGTRVAPTQQFLQSSHMPRAPRPSSSTSSPDPSPNPVNPPLLPTLPLQTPSTRAPAGPRAVASVPPALMVHHTPSIFSTNQGRPQFSHMLPPRTSQARAPAPHLLRFRPQAPIPVTLQQQPGQISCQQQPLPNLLPPCTRPSVAPLSRAYHQSGVPVASHISPTVQSARDGDTTSQLDGWIPSDLAMTNNEVAPASSADARPSASPADVVCISDEE